MEGSTLDVAAILIGLFGGLALFLFGIEQMTEALKAVAGGGMKSLLAKLTTNRFKAAAAGAFVTAVIQSSSVTTVLVVGFISAGIMTLSQSVGIIMGANIGTTITAQIIAFKVTKYALIFVAIGFAMLFSSKREKIRSYGSMLMGLGLIFFGMDLMSSAANPLRSYEPFINTMRRMDNPFFGILISAGFTGLIQSSSATTGVIIVLASQGFITLEAGIALAFGANIGTCITALLAAIGKTREAVQAAVVHVLFNVLGVLLWLGFIDQLAWVVQAISPQSADLVGTARLAAETPRQIANAHTIFNVMNTVLFIGFTVPLAKLVQKLVPERPVTETTVTPRYLDDILFQTPSLALDRARMEMRRLGDRAVDMVKESLPVAITGEKEDLLALAARDDEVDILHGHIVTYLGRLSRENLTNKQSDLLYEYVSTANHMENIGDMIETNIVRAGMERLEKNIQMSDATKEALRTYYEKVCWAVQLSFEAFDAGNPQMAQQVIDAKASLNSLAEAAEQRLAIRLAKGDPDRLLHFRVESELIEYLKRVYYFAKRIAKSVVEMHANGLQEDAATAKVG